MTSQMKQPRFDRDGLPTQETLDAIRFWPHDDLHGVLEFIASTFSRPQRVTRRAGIWYFFTGGCIADEQLMLAFKENAEARIGGLFGCLTDYQMAFPGGHWVVPADEDARKTVSEAIRAFFEVIVQSLREPPKEEI